MCRWLLALMLFAAPLSAQQGDTIQVAGIEIIGGQWVAPSDAWELLHEWTEQCLGLEQDFSLIKFGVADELYRTVDGERLPIGGFTLGLPEDRVLIVWRKDQLQFLDQLVHEFIHAIGGPAHGEFPPGSPSFDKCLPSLRYAR
jgi:hypothetical protein